MAQVPDEKNQPKVPGRRRSLAIKCLSLAALIFAIWAALKIHYLWIEPKPPSSGTAKPPRSSSIYPAVPRSIGDFQDPLAMEGWRNLDKGENPGRIPPPAGAKMIYGYEYPSVDSVVRQARYEFTGQIGEISRHYRSQLESRGFKLLATMERPGAGQIMIFQKNSAEASVLLPTGPKKGRILQFSLIITEQVGNP